MEKAKRLEAIKNCLENLDTDEIVGVWSEYCDAMRYDDDRIEFMSSFNDLLYGLTPLEIIGKVKGCNFSTSDEYFRETIYGFESTDYPVEDGWIDVEAVAKYIEESEKSLYCEKIQECLDELSEEEEEEGEEEIA